MASLTDRMQDDLRAAIKGSDRRTARVLRSALAAVSNAEAQPQSAGSTNTDSTFVAGSAKGVGATEAWRRELSESEIVDIVRRERDEYVTAAHDLEVAGSGSAAAERLSEAEVLSAYLDPAG